MGAQSIDNISIETERDFFEEKMVTEGEEFLLYKYYHLGERPNIHKMVHISNLFKAYSSKNCNVKDFINKQFELDHNYMKVQNDRMCEEFDVCYDHK